MTSNGPGNCNSKNSEVGSDGQCYAYCKDGWSPIDNGPFCALNCPEGFATTSVVLGQSSAPACIRPSFVRETKPHLKCPQGADRQYETCILDCPKGTKKHYNLCVPECPPRFVPTPDGLSCQAEFVKRTAIIREACYANETRVGGRFCLGPCDTGTVPLAADSELCYATVPVEYQSFFWTGDPKLRNDAGPVVAKVIFPRTQERSSCLENFEALNGICYADCPTNSTSFYTECLANCPQGFTVTANKTTCLRPVYQRPIVKSLLQTIGDVFKYIGIALAVVFILNLFLGAGARVGSVVSSITK